MITARKAVITVPVAHLYGTSCVTKNMLDAQPSADCPRLMQLLFNEQVEVITEKKKHGKSLIAITHAFHITTHKPEKRLLAYWIETKNLCLLDALPTSALMTVPPEINIDEPSRLYADTVVTLILPWYDTKTEKLYSAGTRFMVQAQKKDQYFILLWDYQRARQVTTMLPTHYGIRQGIKDSKKQRQSFVKLVKSWADTTSGVIPYVLGGCSFMQKYQTYTPRIKTHALRNSYVEESTILPHQATGLDCAGLILRAAQCCGFPYFYKNTTTLAHFLPSLHRNEEIQEGDLIWIPGHVMIVSDLKKNLLVEARSFYHGYGKVHEIPLAEEFKDMYTYTDLKKAFLHKKRLKRLNAQGNIIQSIPTFKILRLTSVFAP